MSAVPTARRLGALLLPVAATLLLGGCAILQEFKPSVAVKPMTAGEYITLKRGDILTTGELSIATRQTIEVAGLDAGQCAKPSVDCIDALREVSGISGERRLSALSELWLQQAIALPAAPPRKAGPGAVQAAADARLQAWMEAARHAYAYLFFSARTPGERAFEDRQTQVRDYYNHAVEEAITLLFEDRARDAPGSDASGTFHPAGWTLRMDLSRVRLPEGTQLPRELTPASSLSFQGLRSTYRRDGFGAELVAVLEDDPVTTVLPEADTAEADVGPPHRRPRAPAWSEMPSPSLTVLFQFDGDDLDAILATRAVRVSVHDPYIDSSITLHGQEVPLAANFTAGYGLWLARSGFNMQSLRTLFGRERGIDHPHLYMLQPYDPQRRIILMLHGLASSPEAWVNVANEVMGDEALRQNFQVWQVYYPTNMPIVLNHAAIRRLTASALDHFDPTGQAPASHDMVLIGHSMGGVIARLMVSSSDQQLWDWALAAHDIDPARLAEVRPRIDPMLHFDAFPNVERAIFIAAPHRGTDVADHRLGRLIARLVRLPLTVLEGVDEALTTVVGGKDGADGGHLGNSIDNLSARDPFVRAAADLPISPQVHYNSIIARTNPDVPLLDSSDGLVPYRSAHLDGADSEKIITSGHSVQETAQAILEIRRILHEDLAAHAAAAGDTEAVREATGAEAGFP
ncbi:alpha/beta fold hydrolase [Luteimonas sp. BDR2-5]|uniref:esterase/lipase family protein n=1 Tax=Proluteimonas luteida TaxID=2878685 RepID=UPI001E45C138|nr:alpha/beta hydrolase [Luteimonas sp. BDR2-5]MCD9029038.1 alpha/beta fold hydrolase [Luteimonas sp. BDR2-5]